MGEAAGPLNPPQGATTIRRRHTGPTAGGNSHTGPTAGGNSHTGSTAGGNSHTGSTAGGNPQAPPEGEPAMTTSRPAPKAPGAAR